MGDERARVDEHLRECTLVLSRWAKRKLRSRPSLTHRATARAAAATALGGRLRLAAAFAIAAGGCSDKTSCCMMRSALTAQCSPQWSIATSITPNFRRRAAGARRPKRSTNATASGTRSWPTEAGLARRLRAARRHARCRRRGFARRGAASIVYLAPTTPVRTIQLEGRRRPRDRQRAAHPVGRTGALLGRGDAFDERDKLRLTLDLRQRTREQKLVDDRRKDGTISCTRRACCRGVWRPYESPRPPRSWHPASC